MAPAFRSAIEEQSNDIGTELEGTHSNARTQALTDAAVCFGRLRAAASKAISSVSPFWDIP